MMTCNFARTVRLLYKVVKQGPTVLIHLVYSLGISLLLQSRVDEGVDELVRYLHLSRNLIFPKLNQAPGFRKESTGVRVLLGSIEGRSELV